jgi:DNA-binding GntR family transcriptional regulator
MNTINMAANRALAAPSQVAQIVESIREGIRQGRYSPGHRLIESDLTREFGVSRGPVREALGRLQVEGLVEIAPHRGASVRRMTRDDVQELVVVRQMLQGGAARLAALNINRADNRARLKGALAETKKWTRATDPTGYIEANDAVHDLILEIADNHLLATMIRQLRIQAFRLLFVGILSIENVRDSAKGHVAIINAILAGDADEAEAAVRRQLQHTADQALSLIAAQDAQAPASMDGAAVTARTVA